MIEGNTKQLALKKPVSILDYGPYGSGKTWFCASMPKPYFIITEREPKGLAAAGKYVDYVQVETFEEADLVLNEIIAGKRAKDHESICIDSLSELSPLIIASVKKNAGKGQMTDKMNRELWGLVTDYLRVFIRKATFELPKIGKHLCLTAWAMLDKDEATQVTSGSIDTIGKFADRVGGMVDIVLYSEAAPCIIDQKPGFKYQVHTVRKGYFMAKDSFNCLDPVEPADFDTIYKKVVAKMSSHTTAR